MFDLSNKRVVLIGGAGFIGHNLALALRKQGANVSVVDGLEVNNVLQFMAMTNPDENGDLYLRIIRERFRLFREAGIPLIVQDARDYHALTRTLKELNPDYIYHLAAVSHANKSNKDPYSTFDHSLRTLENALDFSRGHDLKRFVYFSSSMVYGHFPPNGIVDEESPCNPLGIYGALKYAGEKMVIAYEQVFDLPGTIIRPSALYGERCVSRRVGQIFIENALRQRPIAVNGTGQDSLDFTYIADLVDGLIRSIVKPAAINEIFNLTYGEAQAIGHMAEIVKSEFPEVEIQYKPKDTLTPDRGTLDVSKARQLLEYDPQYPLDVGYRQYIRWYKDFWINAHSSGDLLAELSNTRA